MGLRGINVNGTNYAIDYNYLDNKPSGQFVPEFNALSDDGKVLSVYDCSCEWVGLDSLPGGVPTPYTGDDGSVLTVHGSGYTWRSVRDVLGVGSSGWSDTDAVLMATLENDDGAYGLEWTSIGDVMSHVLDELETVSYVNPGVGVGSATVMAYDGSDAYMVEGQGGQEILCSSNGSVHWESAHESILAVASLDSVAYETLGYPERNNSIAVYDTSCVPEWRTIGELVGDVQDDDPQTNDNPKFLFVNDSGDLSKCEGIVVPVAGCSFGNVLYNDELIGVSWRSIDSIIDELDIISFQAISAALEAEDNDPGLVLVTSSTWGGMVWGDITDPLERIRQFGSGDKKVLVYDSNGVHWDDPS